MGSTESACEANGIRDDGTGDRVSDVRRVLAALADAARDDRKEEFDRLERELLSNFEGGFDGMPEPIYESYLAIDRLWPVVP